MKVFVKICGLCTPDDVEAVAELKPDAMGFVFWPKSRRAVKAEDVADWTERAAVRHPEGGRVRGCAARGSRPGHQARGLDVVQFHGHEPPEICELDAGQGLEGAERRAEAAGLRRNRTTLTRFCWTATVRSRPAARGLSAIGTLARSS